MTNVKENNSLTNRIRKIINNLYQLNIETITCSNIVLTINSWGYVKRTNKFTLTTIHKHEHIGNINIKKMRNILYPITLENYIDQLETKIEEEILKKL